MAKILTLQMAQSTVGFQREAAYSAIDAAATLQIDNHLDQRMTENDKRTHDFYMAIQGPAIEMTMRGMKIDETARQELVSRLQKELQDTTRSLQTHPTIKPIWDHMEKNTGSCPLSTRKDGKHKWQKGMEDTPSRKCEDCGASRMKVRPFMPSSNDDIQHLLYDLWKLKPIRNKDGNITTDKEARERLRERLGKRQQAYAEPIELIDKYADLAKELGFLKFRSDDGRFHAGFNVGVTSTHRWSSNQDAYGRGSNAQNISERDRHVFVADDGYELCYADLKQAESKVISFVAGDEAYIEAHEGGDTHTFVCRLVWPEGVGGEEWTGDLKLDKKIAKRHSPPWDQKEGHDYRFQSKAVQHGSNLGLTPYGMAIQKRIPVAAAEEGQARYFRAFPGIRNYQQMIRSTIEEQKPIITPLGIRFKLFGRPWDESTYKEALAVIPQSMVGHIISIGVYRIWTQEPEIQLLAQVHDAILFQFPKGQYEYVRRALDLMTVPIMVTGVDGKTRKLVIGTEAAVGHNWGHFDKEHNLNGLREIEFHNDNTWSIE